MGTKGRVRFDAATDLARLRADLERSQLFRSEVPQKRPSILAHALSGAVGAIGAELVLFPIDTVKVLVQTASADEARSFLSTIVWIMREKGATGFYKGVGANVLKESVHSFNYWVWHDTIFRLFSKGDNSKTSMSRRLLLNLIIKQLNWLCTVPFEVVASVNQVSVDGAGFFGTALRLYRFGGLGQFYRGLSISLLLAVNPAITNTLISYFLRLATSLKLRAGESRETAREHSATTVGLATGTAKFLATMATYPLIRAKVLQQTTMALRQQSPLEIWRGIILAEGARGLWRGVLAMTYKAVLWNALMMMLKNALEPRRLATPPPTPPQEDATASWMGRDAFALDSTTAKLEEVLSIVRRDRAAERVLCLERQMQETTQDIHEIKKLLCQLVESSQAAPLPA